MKKYLFKNKLELFLLIICITARAILNSLLALILKKIIDIMTSGTYMEFASFILATLIYFLISIIITVFSNIISLSYLRNINQMLRDELFCHIINLPFLEFKKERIGDFTSKLNNEIDIIINDYIANYMSIYADILSIVIGTCIIFYINIFFSMVMIGVCILLLLIVSLLSKRTVRPRELLIEEVRNYNSIIKEYLSGFATIKNFGIENYITTRFSMVVKSMEKVKYRFGWTVSIFEVFSSYLYFFVILIVLILGGIMSFRNMITIGSLIAIIQLLNNIISPVSDLSTRLTKIKSCKKIVQRYISDTSGKIEEATLKQAKFNLGIHLNDVTYSYDGNYNSIENATINFEKGKKYTIVGPSGSGKSTLYKLFCKYLDSYTGNIYIDGNNLNELDNMYISSIIAVVSQEIFLFNDTLRNNMSLGRVYSDTEIHKILNLVGLNNFVSSQGMGLDYPISEEGNNISGGEKCRIAIGRALLQRKKILILDEAFSGLDNIVAMKIEKDILNIQDLTLINITHKISMKMLKNYNEIVVMDSGKIVEIGDYDSLYKDKKLFFALCNE